MQETGVVERAFELARTGSYTSVTGMRRRLKTEGFTESSIEQHLGGAGVRKNLRDACKAARGERIANSARCKSASTTFSTRTLLKDAGCASKRRPAPSRSRSSIVVRPTAQD